MVVPCQVDLSIGQAECPYKVEAGFFQSLGVPLSLFHSILLVTQVSCSVQEESIEEVRTMGSFWEEVYLIHFFAYGGETLGTSGT